MAAAVPTNRAGRRAHSSRTYDRRLHARGSPAPRRYYVRVQIRGRGGRPGSARSARRPWIGRRRYRSHGPTPRPGPPHWRGAACRGATSFFPGDSRSRQGLRHRHKSGHGKAEQGLEQWIARTAGRRVRPGTSAARCLSYLLFRIAHALTSGDLAAISHTSGPQITGIVRKVTRGAGTGHRVL